MGLYAFGAVFSCVDNTDRSFATVIHNQRPPIVPHLANALDTSNFRAIADTEDIFSGSSMTAAAPPMVEELKDFDYQRSGKVDYAKREPPSPPASSSSSNPSL